MIENLKLIWNNLKNAGLKPYQKEDLRRMIYFKGIERDYHPLYYIKNSIIEGNTILSHQYANLFWIQRFFDHLKEKYGRIALDIFLYGKLICVVENTSRVFTITPKLFHPLFFMEIRELMKSDLFIQFKTNDRYVIPKKLKAHLLQTFSIDKLNQLKKGYDDYYSDRERRIRKIERKHRGRKIKMRQEDVERRDYSITLDVSDSFNTDSLNDVKTKNMRIQMIKDFNSLKYWSVFYIQYGYTLPTMNIEVIDMGLSYPKSKKINYWFYFYEFDQKELQVYRTRVKALELFNYFQANYIEALMQLPIHKRLDEHYTIMKNYLQWYMLFDKNNVIAATNKIGVLKKLRGDLYDK